MQSETAHSLTHHQWDSIQHLRGSITGLAIHPYSGDASVKSDSTTLAIVKPTGEVTYRHRFPDGSLA